MTENGPTLASSIDLLQAQAFLKAIAIPVELQDMAFVGNPVQERASQALIAKDLYPSPKLQVGGDRDAAPEVAVRQDLEQQSSPFWGEGHKPPSSSTSNSSLWS
jgi:hypothetical protein